MHPFLGHIPLHFAARLGAAAVALALGASMAVRGGLFTQLFYSGASGAHWRDYQRLQAALDSALRPSRWRYAERRKGHLVWWFARSLLHVVVVVLTAEGFGASTMALDAIHFRAPFHRDECVPAIKEGLRQLRYAPDSIRGHRILAQGFLCLGLKDDPVALLEAQHQFRSILAKKPDDLVAQIGLADAIRRPAAISDAALQALQDAQQAFPRFDRPAPAWTRQYVESNLEATRHRLAQMRTLSSADCRRRKQDTPQASVARCLRTKLTIAFERREATYNETLPTIAELSRLEASQVPAMVWQAELLRQRGDYPAATALFQEVTDRCSQSIWDSKDVDCAFARQHLAKLAEVCGDWGQLTGEPSLESPCTQPQHRVGGRR